MAAFMHHRDHVVKRSCCIHKNKWRAGLGQRAVITTRCFALAAFQVKPPHLIHFLQTARKERVQVVKSADRFFQEFSTGTKRL